MLAAFLGIAVHLHPDAQAEERRVPSQSIEVHRLPNGLSVILAPEASLPIVAVAASYHVGAASEETGRTEFSHLFEHLLVAGTEPVAGAIRRILESGGRADATTHFDRTYYYQQVPANYLELVLWLESYRMGFLVPQIGQATLDLQRSVIRNEHRQNRENAPYGMAFWRTLSALYPPDHPYAIPVDNWLADLDAATLDEVRAFHARFYRPGNATLAIVGDFEPQQALRLVETYFADIPAGPAVEHPAPQPLRLDEVRPVVLEDRVELPALFLTWPTDPLFADGDAELHVLAHILAGGRGSRLHRRLIEEEGIAQAVAASQESWALAGQFGVVVHGAPGQGLEHVRDLVDQEIGRLLTDAPPTEPEVARALNTIERRLAERDESALQRAVQLTLYQTVTGDAGYGARELARYQRVTPASVQRTARRYLVGGRVELSIVPASATGRQPVP